LKPIKIMIAEDERLAREELIYLLQLEEDLEILPSASTGRELLELTRIHKPQVVFLDVQMPEMEGIEAASRLKAAFRDILLVFTTAYEDYAVTAFGLNAIDYLLKPYSHDRLKETLQRIRERLGASAVPAVSQTVSPALSPPSRKLNKLLLEDGTKHVLLNPESILYAVREERVIRIHTAEGQNVASKLTLQELEEKLKGFAFFRPHRSYLVNINQIEEIVPWFNGAYNIIMKDGKRTPIPLSREAAKELFRTLKGDSN